MDRLTPTVNTSLLLTVLTVFTLVTGTAACESKSSDEAETAQIPPALDGERLDEIDLADYRGETRPLLVFTPSLDNRDFRELLTEIRQHQEQLDSRDVKVFHFVLDEAGWVGNRPISKEASAAMRKRFAILDDGFTFVQLNMIAAPVLRAEEALRAEKLVEKIDENAERREAATGKSKQTSP